MLLERLSERGTKFLNVKYPIISGGMTWVSNVALVKAVSQHGIFPVLAGGNLPPDAFEKEVDQCLQELAGPFAVNLITIAPNYKTQYKMKFSFQKKFLLLFLLEVFRERQISSG